MNRKRGEGLSLKGEKRGGLCSGGGAVFRSFRKERIEFFKVTLHNLFYLSLEVGREKVNMIFALVFTTKLSTLLFFFIREAQSHTLTSMMETTSALRRSNEQEFPALLYF